MTARPSDRPAVFLRPLMIIGLLPLALPLAGAADYPPEPRPKDPAALKLWEEQYLRAVQQEQAEINRRMADMQQQIPAATAPRATPAPSRGNRGTVEPVVPPRNEAEIKRVPAVPPAFARLAAEAERIAKTLRARLDRDDLDDAKPFLTRYAGNANALASAAALAWVEKSPGAALLLAAEAVRARPADENAINTLGALLCHAGYAHQGIPILQALATKLPDDATVLNNLGQAWLSIGEVEKAKTLLLLCVRRAPAHGAAHAALGAINQAAGDTAGANTHYQAAVASNDSPSAGRALSRQNIRYGVPRSLDRLVITREYFNPSHFLPPRPQFRNEQFKAKTKEKAAFDDYVVGLQRKLEAQARAADREVTQAMRSGRMPAQSGLFAGLAMRRMEAEAADALPFIEREQRKYFADIDMLRADRDNKIKAVSAEFERDFGKRYGEGMDRATEEAAKRLCAAKESLYNDFLRASADRYGLLESMVLPRSRALTNTMLAYLPLTVQGQAYQAQFAHWAAAYLKQTVYLNHATVTDNFNCKPLPEAGAAASPTGVPPEPGDCLIKLKRDIVIGEIAFSCSGVSIDFKAGLAFSAKKDFRTGETTLTAGLGEEEGLAGIGKVSGAEQFLLVWDRNNNLSFVGVEASAEASLGKSPNLKRTADLGDGLKAEVSPPDLVPKISSVKATMRLGVTLGPDGPTPTVSGNSAATVLGRQLFEAKL